MVHLCLSGMEPGRGEGDEEEEEPQGSGGKTVQEQNLPCPP